MLFKKEKVYERERKKQTSCLLAKLLFFDLLPLHTQWTKEPFKSSDNRFLFILGHMKIIPSSESISVSIIKAQDKKKHLLNCFSCPAQALRYKSASKPRSFAIFCFLIIWIFAWLSGNFHFLPFITVSESSNERHIRKRCNKHCLQSAAVEQNIHIKKHNETLSVWYYRKSNHPVLLFWILYLVHLGPKKQLHYVV